MKESADLFVLIVTILTVLLTMGMVLVEFESFDTTLVAGIIAFVGAIIGGFITLIGVRKTIEEDRRKTTLSLIPIRIKSINDLENEIFETITDILIAVRDKEFSERFVTDLISKLSDKSSDAEVMMIGRDVINYLNELEEIFKDNFLDVVNSVDRNTSYEELYINLQVNLLNFATYLNQTKIELRKNYFEL